MSEPKLTALPQADSTNLYCKAHLDEMGQFDAVWTTCQPACSSMEHRAGPLVSVRSPRETLSLTVITAAA